MLVLGIEGSANKIGVGVVRGETVLANIRRTYIPPTGAGFKITAAAEHHQQHVFAVFRAALSAAAITVRELDYLAYTEGPGIGPCLQIVALFVKIVAEKYQLPVVPVNHCVAHIEMGRFITRSANPTVLYVSGGNTQVITYGAGKYRIFGETLDLAVGNCLDRLARALHLPNDPSPGYQIEQMAKQGTNYLPLPYSVKGMDVSFSGMISYITRYLKDKELTDALRADLCYSVQETAFAMLIEVTERAMACTGSNEVLVVGGVGCNRRLQEMAAQMARQRQATSFSADERYCIDNGLMIAHTAYKMVQSGYQPQPHPTCQVTQRYRTDTVPVTWRESEGK